MDSSIIDDDPRLAIDGYRILRCDHPSDSRRGGVCIFYRDHLSLFRRPDLTSLDECLVCELKSGANLLFLCLCYRSPSQDADQFDIFQQKWEETIININNCSPTVSIFLGDFNARNSDWWTGDITNSQGKEIGDLASQHGLSQIIDKPTHILSNSSSCIDLIFTSAINFISESGVLPSLFPRCHHQVVFVKVNFKVSFPPAYNRRIWDFSRADPTLIKRAVEGFDWDRAFEGLDVDGKVLVLTDCIVNIFSNFVPNKVITIRNKDALWMTPGVKRMILEKAKIYRRFVKNGRRADDYHSLRDITNRCKVAIDKAKEAYLTRLGNSLNDPNIASKRYWSIINKFLQKRKMPKIPPVRDARNVLVSNVTEKANIFNQLFAAQCSLIDTDSVLPADSIVTDLRLDSIVFDESKILALIRALNVNKAHGHDDVSIRMIKICDDSIVKPLIKVFQASLNSHRFPKTWKKANVVPVFKKGDKSVVKNYRPVSLLPIFGKIYEKCIYDTLYNYFDGNNLFSSCQSGFRKGDSCISQLLSITHDIFKGFDATPSLDTRGVFLDISKAFDRVWHEGLIFKLKSYGISGSLLKLMQDFLSGRFQRVVLNGKVSDWAEVLAGVPQGSILGPLLFLIFINDLPVGLLSEVKVFADDTSLFSLTHNQLRTAAELNSDLLRVSEWAYQWKMSFNPDPSKQAVEVYFSKKQNHPISPFLSFNNTAIAVQSSQKHLGLILDSKLVFDQHLNEKILKANQGIGLLNRLRKYLPRDSLLTIYKAFIRPHLDYGDIIYDYPGNATFAQKLESVQYNACLAITGCFRGSSREKLYSELGIESLSDRRYSRRLFFFYKIVKGLSPKYLSDYLPRQNMAHVNLRSRPPINPMYARTERYRASFFPFCISEWNKLDSRIRDLPSISRFKRAIFQFIRPEASSTFHVTNNKGLVLLNRLRVGFSHLREHKFRHGFSDTVDPFCDCRTDSIETTKHFLLQCSNYSEERRSFFDNLQNINIDIFPLNTSSLCRLLLYGDASFTVDKNREILEIVIRFICESNRFSGPLF